MSATEIPKASDVIKEGEHFLSAALDAAHKMIADTLTPAPAKAEAAKTEAHPAATKPAEAAAPASKSGEHAPTVDSKTSTPGTAAKPADHAATPTSTAGKENASSPKNAYDKITSADIQEAKNDNLGNIASFLYDAAIATGSAAFLPEVAIVGAVTSAAGAVSDAVGGIFSSDKPANKSAGKPADKPTEKPTASTTSSQDQVELGTVKHPVTITDSDKAFTYKDWLKQSGCSDGGDSCKVSPDAMAGLGIKVTPGNPKQATDLKGQVNAFQTAMTHEQWQHALDIINKQSGKHLSVKDWDNGGANDQDKGSIETDKNGIKTHYDADHRADWVKNGDVTTEYGKDGTVTTVNSQTGDVTMKDAQGHDMVTRDKTGKFTITAPNGEAITLNANTGDVNIGTSAMANLNKNEFTLGDTKVLLFTGSLHQGLLNANNIIGQNLIMAGDGWAVAGKPGMQIMLDTKNGVAGLSIDANSILLRDSKGVLSIRYSDGRPDVTLSASEQAALFASKNADLPILAKLKTMMETLIATHKLNDGHGNIITTDQNNNIQSIQHDDKKVEVQPPAQAGTAPTQFVLSSAATPIQKVDIAAHTDDVIDAKGKLEAHLALVNGKTTVRTDNVYFDGDKATTSNGTVISAQGATFADGTQIRNNGVVIDQYGTTYDNAGDAVPTQGTYKTDVAKYSDGSQESVAKSQVSQAEGIAASIRARVAGGHVTAGDIAALAGSMASLSVLVSSMSQFGDAGALASAVMAEDEVAGSMEMAMASLHTAPVAMQAA